MISSEMIARVAAMKNATPEKVLAVQHALEINNSEMRFLDPVCTYRLCLHHFSIHGHRWKDPTTGKWRRCVCKHMRSR